MESTERLEPGAGAPAPTSAPQDRRDNSFRQVAHLLILEHIMAYPGTFPLPSPIPAPLKTPDAATAHQPQPEWPAPVTPETSLKRLQTLQRKSSGNIAHPSATAPAPMAANAQFVSSLFDQVSSAHASEPRALPPTFICNFLRNCFPKDLHLVDFPQALVALDYLRDLESRRKREIAAGKKRLKIDIEALELDPDYVSSLPAGVMTWYSEMELAQRKSDALYTQVYIGLRRWVIINELSVQPLDKHNALTMVNVLYPHPPGNESREHAIMPTPHLTPSVLLQQRVGFLKFITAVESRGPLALKPLMDQGKPKNAPNSANGWSYVSHALDQYLRVVLRTIEEASCVRSREDLELIGLTPPRPLDQAPPAQSRQQPQPQAHKQPEQQPTRKSDPGSGVTAGVEALPSKENENENATAGASVIGPMLPATTSSINAPKAGPGHSSHSSTSTVTDKNKALPPAPAGATLFVSPVAPTTVVKNFSRLEKLASEIRNFKAVYKRQNSYNSQPLDDVGNKEDKENAPAISRTHHSRDGSAGEPVVIIEAKQRPLWDATSIPPKSSLKRPAEEGRGRSLRSLRSLGDLRSSIRSRSNPRTRSKGKAREAEDDGRALESPKLDLYDREEMLRQRAIWEARHQPDH